VQHHRRLSRSLRVISIAVVVAVALFAVAMILTRNSSNRPAGLIQAGNSKTNCIYVHLGPDLHQVEQTTGITYNCIETFSNQAATWADWIRPRITSNEYGYAKWVAADPAEHQIILTLNVIPDNVASDPGWTAKCAAGDYNGYASKLARNLVGTGFGYSVIRLGSEMNGTWNAGDLGTTVTAWHQWGQCFAQEVEAMRSVRGTHFLFDWNINANYRNIPLADFYPGNAYVDIIGIDAYDLGPADIDLPPVGNPARWTDLAAEPEGLNVVEAFAAAHGKPISFPEWATCISQGDDGDYVAAMGTFIAKHDVAFQSWFDVGDDGIFQLSRTQAPLSLTAYKKAFG
jgi:Glycosyl hydrolase family 26